VANVAKITVNLPRAAFRSARDSRSCLERELEEVLARAVKGHLERRGFLERTAANREAPLWDVLGGGAAASERGARSAAGEPLVSLATGEYAIGVVGLNECVKFLTGKELHQDPVARRTGEEIIGRMARFLARESRSLGIRLVLEESRNLGPLQALEHADRERHPQAVEIDRGRDSQWGPRYTDGVRFHRVAPLDPLRRIEELAPYLRYLRPAGGVVDDFPELRSSARELLLSLLEESLPALDGELTASRCRGEGTEA
jgi:ribonucleoside-triphosphate reductase